MNIKFSTTVAILFLCINVFAQIAYTDEEIINKEGTNFTKEYGKNDDGSTDYSSFTLTYNVERESEVSGKYTQTQDYYFFIGDESTLCYQIRYSEPASEANSWINYFEKQGYVKEKDKLEWTDYGGKRKRQVFIEDGVCMVYIWYFNPSSE